MTGVIGMYEELVKRLREESEIERWLQPHSANETPKLLDDAAHAIEELSKERKTGKWIYPSDITGFGRCSECKALWDYSLITNKYFKICPRCGSYNGGDEDV